MKSIALLPCSTLRGVGPQLAARLAKLGLHTVQDLLFHLPSRYEDRTRVVPIRELRSGDHVVVEGFVTDTQLRFGRRRSLLCALEDGTGTISLRFFHFNQAQQTQLANKELRIRCFGEVRLGMAGFEMVHPEYQFLNTNTPLPVDEYLTPVYPTTEGLQQRTFRQLTEQALHCLEHTAIEDYLPLSLLQQFSLPDLISAIRYVHRPPPDAPRDQLIAGLHPTQQRLAFEELLAHQLSQQKRRSLFKQYQAPTLAKESTLLTRFVQNLAFKLTAAQVQVVTDIKNDLTRNTPMLRLVQGDVGSGKTVVAAISAIQAISQGYQVALMAPTELLAEQHAQNFARWLQPLNLQSACLTSSLKSAERLQILAALQSGNLHMAIGTHALFQKEINFAKLALIIIDEQHRFGVQQRLELREKGAKNNEQPHQLLMTATPIPRTLAMTAYADLDISSIDELPPGRKPITTTLISTQRRDEIIVHIAQACQKKRQAYWVCTLIEESDLLQCQAAEATARLLTQQLPHSLKVGLIHGRLKAPEKEQIMADFKAGLIDILVATTVIEVGVDVPNATLMVIENAERLGLAQLHQLRGRVGRGDVASHCVLLYQMPLSALAKERLKVLKNHQDGFEIARQDLELRGPGDVLGTRQAGLMMFKIADLLRDQALLPNIQAASLQLLRDFPSCVEQLITRWIGQDEKFGRV
jgi:ATP-dependent DNA helicase RecG